MISTEVRFLRNRKGHRSEGITLFDFKHWPFDQTAKKMKSVQFSKLKKSHKPNKKIYS